MDAQLIASTLLNPQKNGKELKQPGLSFIFKQLFPGEKYKEHDALEDARATFKVYNEVKSRLSLDDSEIRQRCPGFDPRRDKVEKLEKMNVNESFILQKVENVLKEVVGSVVDSSKGWMQ